MANALSLPVPVQFLSSPSSPPIPSEEPAKGGFPLRLSQEGDRVRIVALQGGSTFQNRMAGMGLQPGTELQILNNGQDGRVLVASGSTRLFLGGGMAQKIQVIPVKGNM
nr:FeoA family protein [uncultured Holophaga sp.]